MKTSLASLDIHVIVGELRKALVGGYVDKAYQPSYDEILLTVTGGGQPRRKVLVHIGRFVCLTTRDREMPQSPSPFAMLLRKHLAKARIVGVEQLGFDRIVVVHLHGRGSEFRLVCELFRNGTVILVKGDEIVRPVTSKHWGSREVKAGHVFKPPAPRANPMTMAFPEFAELVRASDSDIVRTLATRVGLGGEYAEGLLAVAGEDPGRAAAEMSDEELGLLFEEMGSLFERADAEPRPHVIRRDDEVHTVLPLVLNEEAGDVTEGFDTFNEAVDAYFAEGLAEAEAEDFSDEYMGHVNRLRHQAEQQRHAAESYEAEISVNQRRGDLIYANFQHCEAVLRDLLEAKEALGWREVERRVAETDLVGEINTHDGYVSVPLTAGEGEPEGVKLRFNLTIPENAEFYYTKAKRAREKSAGAIEALQETEERLAKAEEAARKAQEEGAAMVEEAVAGRVRQKRTKRHWFERYRWTLATDGTIIVGGKDASSNERVVKKYLKDRDRYCHADFHGAPSVVVKDPGDGVSEDALEQGCAVAAIFSRAWSSGRASADAYWVMPEQVSKTPQSGEFVPKGGFIIRGRRNYIKDIQMRAAVGLVEFEGDMLVMAGPVAALSYRSKSWVELEPSKDRKEGTAKQVARMLGAELDEVVAVLPPGGCRVAASHGISEDRA
ncbi:MAG: NFACT family protein [Thermoplasmata archaeon]|nr:MAG: NFACT family protein [Thermoplasmata archaeon]